MRSGDLSKTLDHTLLGPDVTRDDVERACALARDYHVAALCVGPEYGQLVADRLRQSDVQTCVRIGAGSSTDVAGRSAAAERAVRHGANEIDVCLSVSAMRAGGFAGVRHELAHIAQAVRTRATNDARGTVLVKAIIDAPLLEEAYVRLACKIVTDVGVDFAMTCSGIDMRASSHDVELLRASLPGYIGVSASGGVRGPEDVHAMIFAGATRIGSAHPDKLLDQLRTASGRPHI